MRRGACGVALITALLVVAIAALAATALLGATQLSIHRTAAARDSEQGWWVARGVEAWVLGILRQDAEDSDVDGLGEDWARPIDYLPVDQGFIRGGLVDLQGRFNLNNLAGKDSTQVYQPQFQRLLAALPVEAPPGLTATILDWIDPDQNPGFPTGAEDTAYMSLDPPYRAANRPFTVVSELLAVQGMTPELYEALRPLVAALPADAAPTPINVNTAPEAVLRSLSHDVDESKLRQFVERRTDEPAKSVQDFKAQVPMTEPTPPLDVKTSYFQIQGEVFVGSSRVALYSLIHRPDPGTPTVLAHSADAE